jgi:threonyl-tRNA synthetase
MILTMFGNAYEVAENSSVGDLIKAQMPDDLKKYLAVKLEDGTMQDLFAPVAKDQVVTPVTFDDEEGRKVFFHSASHLMAMAVKQLYPEAKVAIGPAIADGFYYDFDVEVPFKPEDLAKIEKEMQHLAKKSIRPRRYLMAREDAIAYFTEKEEPYKVELIQDLPEGEEISFYEMGDFTVEYPIPAKTVLLLPT